jgi:hypothetical protein
MPRDVQSRWASPENSRLVGCGLGPSNQLPEAKRQRIPADGPGQKPVDMAAAVAAANYGRFERQDDWSSCCYFHLDRATNELPPLAAVGLRNEGLLP